MKRIVICTDGTWKGPEENLQEDQPTNVLKIARAITPAGYTEPGVIPQQVFYDWGVGSDQNAIIAGITGAGLHKNIVDCYRYLVQNYDEGDEIYLFGFSRGAYTVRSLCGMINNVGIIRRPYANRIYMAFAHYKNPDEAYRPEGAESVSFRRMYCHPSRQIKFVGVWDTVGAMGIPISFLGLFSDKDEFYDNKMGSNIAIARHALAIDEHRQDFVPTIWQRRNDTVDMKQVWFAGAHSDIGGGYPVEDGRLLSDVALKWMIEQAQQTGLVFDTHLTDGLQAHHLARVHDSRVKYYLLRGTYDRPIDHNPHNPHECRQIPVLIHSSVRQKWFDDPTYRPRNLTDYLSSIGDWDNVSIEH